MGRGVSSGGGQSSLGYLFGDPAPGANAPAARPRAACANAQQQPNSQQASAGVVTREAAPIQQQAPKELPAAGKVGDTGTSLDMGAPKLGRHTNNYQRADGQNTGNFITDRPSTKVHSAPGGGSSLGYLFGGN